MLEPEDDSALYYVNQLRATDPHNAGLPQVSSAVQGQILDRARTAIDGGDSAKADALLQMAGVLGESKESNALTERIRAAALSPVDMPQEVTEATLTRIKKLSVDYPARALGNQIEGEVQVAYTVSAKGAVTDIKVIRFESAGHLRCGRNRCGFPLALQARAAEWKAVSVTTKLRVIFHLSS